MQIAYIMFWWLALEIIGLVSFPLVSRICGRLKDQGYAISKPFGLLFLTFFTWLLSSIKILPFGYASILISFAVLAGISLYFGRNNLQVRRWPRREILASEAAFAVPFIIFLLVKMGKPDIYFSGADYFMDFAFTKSILNGGYFPPIDPWFGGQSLPYYYGGHLIVAILTMLTRVPPEISFNIAVAMYFAITVSVSYGLGYNVTGRRLYGAMAAVFVCFAGFLTGTYQLIGYVKHTSILGASTINAPNMLEWMRNFDFWSAPWLIPGAMAQYPYYIFLAGTLHAFMMSIPFQIMFITLIFALFIRKRSGEEVGRSDTLLWIAVLAVCMGFFLILNTWDYPVYLVFMIAVFVLLGIRRGIKRVLIMLIEIAAIIGLSLLLYLPFLLSMGMGGFGGIHFVVQKGMLVIEPTDFASFFEAIGFFLFLIGSFVFLLFPRWRLLAKSEPIRIRGFSLLLPRLRILQKSELRKITIGGLLLFITAVILLIATIVIAKFTGFHVLVIVVPAILIPLYFIFKSNILLLLPRCRSFKGGGSTKLRIKGFAKLPLPIWRISSKSEPTKAERAVSTREFILLLVAIGAALALFCELFYIDDPYGQPWERFNTVFKFYVPLWVFFGLSSAYAIYYFMKNVPKRIIKIAWALVVIVFTVAVLIHPIASTISATSGRHLSWGMNRGTLDGMEYLESIYPDDYLAIKWLDENITGSPVILEAPGAIFTYTSRVSTFTGLPTVVGWTSWEAMWRGFSPEIDIGGRENDVNTVYNTANNEQAIELLNKYNVQYIYIGSVERNKYTGEGLQKFNDYTNNYNVIYQNDCVIIYQFKED
jgi:YYY domain-containing protein